MGRGAKTHSATSRGDLPTDEPREAVALDGVGVATAPQRRSEEGEDRAAIEAIEGENDHDLDVGHRRVVYGGLDARIRIRIELAIAGPPWEEVRAR